MRPLAVAILLTLAGCAGPVARWDSPALRPLYETRTNAVNMGTYRPVTNVDVIHGNIWIY